MRSLSTTNRVLVILVATLMLMTSAALAWGVTVDYQSRGVVPQGVTVAGENLGGLDEAQARTVIEQAVSAPMLRPRTVVAERMKWQLDPRDIVTVDVDKMLDEAYSSRRKAAILARMDSQLTGRPLPYEVTPAYSVDTTALAAWVAQAAKEVDRAPSDATRTIDAKKYAFKITKSVPGARLSQRVSVEQIAQALSAEAALSEATTDIVLPVVATKAKVHESSFGTAIIVSLSECRIRLYEGEKLIKTYRCAPGRAAFPTPRGDFEIVSKQRYAPWINPGSAWAANMPPVIPGGPSNPMGTTKIGINVRGIFMHGVPPSEFSSIGRPASHGCMRMMPSDVLDLYGRVKVGNPVYIRR